MLNYLVRIVPTDGRASTDTVLTNLGSRNLVSFMPPLSRIYASSL